MAEFDDALFWANFNDADSDDETINTVTVTELQQLSRDEKISAINKGRPTPAILIAAPDIGNSNTYVHTFSENWYQKKSWLCGCEVSNALFCFPCLIFGDDTQWSGEGFTDIGKLSSEAEKHEKSKAHVSNVVILEHNKRVATNRKLLSAIINCVMFYGRVKSQGHVELEDDEMDEPKDYGLFRSLINYFDDFTSGLKNHMDTVFKDISMTIQSDIFESIVCVYRDEVKQEIQEAFYVAVIVEEVDITDYNAMVLILRYELNGEVHERFWEFFVPEHRTADSISTQMLKMLQQIFEGNTQKLIAQTFDGNNFMKGIKAEVQGKIQAVYGNAHFVDSYTTDVFSILKNVSCTRHAGMYFYTISEISPFFSQSPRYVSVLDKHMKMDPSIKRPAAETWTVANGTIERVYDNLQPLLDCFYEIRSTFHYSCRYEVLKFVTMMDDDKFDFWLELFYHILPHMEAVYKQMSSHEIDVSKVKDYVAEFSTAISLLRDSKYCENSLEEHARQAKELCDIIIMDISYRYSSVKHLVAAKLLDKKQFRFFNRELPSKEIQVTAELYPEIDAEKLENELKEFYGRPELHDYSTLIELLRFFISDDDMFQGFTEITKLIKLLVTIPMATPETDRCFLTLKYVKHFLKKTAPTIPYEGIEPIAVVGLQEKFLKSLPDLHDKVIDHYAQSKERGVDFIYK